MDPCGPNVLARWREAGEWWRFEPYREYRRFLDDEGIVREAVREAASLGSLAARHRSDAPPEDHTQEWNLRARRGRAIPAAPSRHDAEAAPYVPLHVCSGHAFGRGLIHASELPKLAAERGLPAVALADPFSLAAAVFFVKAARLAGVKPLVGASFEMPEGGELVLIARSKEGYQSLSELVTECHLGEPRLYPLANWERLGRHSRDLLCLTGGDVGPLDRLATHGRLDEARALLRRLADLYGPANVFVEIERSALPWEVRTNRRLLELAGELGLACVAGGLTTHAVRADYPAQDVLVCAHALCTIDELIGRKPPRDPSQPQIAPRPERALNAERCLATRADMAARFADAPELLANTLAVASRCDDDVLPGRTRLPELYEDDVAMLEFATYEGAYARHGRVLPADLRRRLEHELARIVEQGFARHFLTIWDACRWAGDQGILFSGRGSVVDCAVAYCLGISRIDAYAHDLHFDRFLPGDGSKRPDIDIDFEAHRRDDVRNYLTRKYGERRVATVAAIGTYGTRGIVREVGKAFGISEEAIGFLAKRIHGGVSPDFLEKALEARPELRNSGIPKERFEWVLRLAHTLADVPRNIRSHSSGVVISDRPLAETVPVMWSGAEDVRIIQWDKRAAKPYFDKFDILCLRGQDVLSGAQSRIRATDIGFDVQQIPLDDEETYRTMRAGQLIGIPQSASPAMRQAHVRLRTANLHDASLVQAGIRPGVGGAVKINELIARRRGIRPYEYEHPELERILGKSYGIIVFQEQVDELLQSFCGYTSGQAEEIREAIHERRKEDYGQIIRDELMERMAARGFRANLADRVFDLVAGFKGYGFAQGHALAFAEISVRSIYCQQNYPAEYFAALLDAQPAGYYGPCTLANEARARGVTVLPVDVNRSTDHFEVEDVKSLVDPQIVVPRSGIRVSLRQVSGLEKETIERLMAERAQSPFASFFDFVARVRPARDEIERLILAGGFESLHPNRRALLWALPAALDHAATLAQSPGALPLDYGEPALPEGIEDFLEHEKAIQTRTVLDLDVQHHLMGFERERVAARGGLVGSQVAHMKPGTRGFLVGNPIRLRFPPTSSGKRVVFFDLEDESGLVNVTAFDDVYQRDGHAIICSPYVTVCGIAQDRDGHIAFLAERVYPYRPVLNLAGLSQDALPIATADFLVG